MRQLSSRSTDFLVPDALAAAAAMSVVAEHAGLDLLIYATYRDPWEQARLYRQSRSIGVIERTADRLRNGPNPEMADILMDVGPQSGRRVTGVPPGESWHQWGCALDAVPWMDTKTLAWDIKCHDERYDEANRLWQIYGSAVRQAGMVWGEGWGDLPHCQIMDAHSNPLWVLSSDTKVEWAERMGWDG